MRFPKIRETLMKYLHRKLHRSKQDLGHDLTLPPTAGASPSTTYMNRPLDDFDPQPGTSMYELEDRQFRESIFN